MRRKCFRIPLRLSPFLLHTPYPQAGHVINYPLFIVSAAGAYLLFWAQAESETTSSSVTSPCAKATPIHTLHLNRACHVPKEGSSRWGLIAPSLVTSLCSPLK